MGNMYLAATGSSGSGSYTFLIVIVVLFGLLYFVMIRPQRNRQRQVQQMQQQVQPGQRVRTTAGMYATVLEADDQDVLLEVAPGVHIRFLRRAVMEIVPDEDGAAGGGFAEDTAAADETGTAAEPAAEEPSGTGYPEAAAPAEASTAEPGADEVTGHVPGTTGHRNGSAPDGAAGGRTPTGEHSAE